MSTQPPRIANWLLRHFGSSPSNEMVIGDLNERYQRGRSRLWYWRQAVAAIVVSFLNEVWSHKFLTIRVVAVGWAIDVLTRHVFDVTGELLRALESWSRTWRADWITLAVQLPGILLIGVFSGWVIATRNRQSQKAMVLTYSAYFAGVHIFWLVRDLSRGAPRPFISSTVGITLTLVGILVGGGMFSFHRHNDSERNCATV